MPVVTAVLLTVVTEVPVAAVTAALELVPVTEVPVPAVTAALELVPVPTVPGLLSHRLLALPNHSQRAA